MARILASVMLGKTMGMHREGSEGFKCLSPGTPEPSRQPMRWSGVEPEGVLEVCVDCMSVRICANPIDHKNGFNFFLKWAKNQDSLKNGIKREKKRHIFLFRKNGFNFKYLKKGVLLIQKKGINFIKRVFFRGKTGNQACRKKN